MIDSEVLLYTIDAFTDVPYSGNPAAVCFVGDKYPSDKILQKVAAEINLSETAFVLSKSNDYKKEAQFGLRWFTPTNEVPLCGHATLASAAALFEAANNESSCITFSTLSGELYARKDTDKYITMDLPLNKPKKCEEIKSYSAICEAVFSNSATQLSQIDEIYLSNTAKKLAIKMNNNFSQIQLEKLKPDIEKMLKVHDGSLYKGVIVTIKGQSDIESEEYDFMSRYFAPWYGIPEDPVTGSAHTVLTPLWSDITGKSEMLARQCSKRGGDIKVKLRDDGRVDVSGRTVLVIKGSLLLPK